MATQSNTGNQNQQGSSSGSGSARAIRDLAQNAMSTDTLIDIVQRLGLVDIVVNRLRSRIEESDVDELINEVTDYFRRNPEMIVVALGTLTVAAAAVVFLTTREDDDDEDGGGSGSRSRSTSRRTTASTRADLGDLDIEAAVGRAGGSGRSRSTGGSTGGSRRGGAREE